MQWRLDKEGKEFHHFDGFAQMYTAEIKNLNRILDSLVRTGMIPTGFNMSSTQVIKPQPSCLLQRLLWLHR